MAGHSSARAADAPLARYNAKRDFSATDEPKGRVSRRKGKMLAFVVQKHWASHLHYDFRLELDGVMLSWAVPKGPSMDPTVKRMAVHVEDHPLSYNTFEGTIPKGHYGAGQVIVWDRGSWEPLDDPKAGLRKGKLAFRLHGEKLAGAWELVRIAKSGQKQEAWLLLKKRGDAWAQASTDYDVLTALPDSVIAQPLGLIEERDPREAGAVASDRSGSSSRKSRNPSSAPDLSRSVKARLPLKLAPQLATLVAEPPASGAWVIENKWDGYRVLVKIAAGKVKLFTRNGNDWTSKLRPLADELEQIGIDKAWLDGEMVVMDEKGIPDFNRLQNAIDRERSQEIVLYLFDVPFLGDRDLRQVPLRSRRAVLRELLQGAPSGRIRFSEELPPGASDVLDAACRLGLEGVMLKRADAPYASGRSDAWLKLKCQRRQEFIVIGYTDRANARGEIGSLLLGFHDEAGALRSAGSVGTGWNGAQREELHRRLAALKVKTPAVDAKEPGTGRWSGGRAARSVHWVRPRVVVEVAFAEWTPDGRIRHASYRGLREDKPAQAVQREGAVDEQVAKVRISHPDRVIDASSGARKIDLVHYYESVAERMLPHLRDRPVALLRAPKGIAGSLFFQKHSEAQLPGVTELDPKLWPEHEPLLAIDGVEGLIGAAQMNVIEFHTWNAKVRHIDRPDRIVFDLDPGEGVGWARVREAAVLTASLLKDLGLRSWLKTSGGKGLHVVVPISTNAQKLGHEEVKAFSKAVVLHMAKTLPRHFVAKSGANNRKGRIFIDYLRNGLGQTTAAAFSARARPGIGVSMPIGWDALDEVKKSDQWTIANAREYLSFETKDPWSDYWKSRQTLAKASRLIGLA